MSELFDAVIIGAGLGGLSAGAYLSRAGRKVLVLEQSDVIGGRCRSFEIMGRRFDIGADYFGSKMLARFEELGKLGSVEPLSFNVLAEHQNHTMTLPQGIHTLRDLSRMGVSLPGMITMSFRIAGILKLGNEKKFHNNHELIRHITDNPHFRDILNIGAYFTGNDPENMPTYWFRLLFGDTYGYAKPFYPKKGAQSLPDLLAEVISENGGGIVLETPVEKITVEGGRATGVVADGREIKAHNVISNINILTTVDKLSGKDHFPYGFLDTLSYYREGLAMASVFVTFRRTARIKKGVHIYAGFSDNMREMFRVLGEGKFPDSSMFVLSCPDAVEEPVTENLAGTVKFLVPKGGASKEDIMREADKVLKSVDRLVPAFYDSIVESVLLTPDDYKEHFGFVSLVSPVAESIHYDKFPVGLPLPGLYCVGSTVLPVGGCTASAVDSGRDCAESIIGEAFMKG